MYPVHRSALTIIESRWHNGEWQVQFALMESNGLQSTNQIYTQLFLTNCMSSAWSFARNPLTQSASSPSSSNASSSWLTKPTNMLTIICHLPRNGYKGVPSGCFVLVFYLSSKCSISSHDIKRALHTAVKFLDPLPVASWVRGDLGYGDKGLYMQNNNCLDNHFNVLDFL